jgi:tetratricopeptide (TPR) repeat protein
MFDLGVSLEKSGQISQSIQIFKQLIQLDSTNSNALNYLGYMLVEEEKELGTAITLINKALAREPKNGAFLDSKGWWYYKKKNYPKAREYIEKALQAGAQDVVILEHLALVLEKMGDMDSAREQWTLILKLNPNHKLANSRVN